jgi:hypothetical protein
MRPVLLFLLGSISVFAQPFSAGIKAGIPLTDFLNAAGNGTFDYTRPPSDTSSAVWRSAASAGPRRGVRCAIPAAELHRLRHLDGLPTFTTVSATGSNWEFPLLLKYRFHFPVVRPYVDAGVAWDTIAGLKATFSRV